MAIRPIGALPPGTKFKVPVEVNEVLFQCDNKHLFSGRMADWKRGRGCPVCRGLRVFSGQNDLATTHPQIAQEWDSDKNMMTPDQVTAGLKLKVWWKCAQGHSWEALINNRKKNGCPVCSRRKTLVGINDITSTNPELSREFDSKKNSISIEFVRENQERPVWWRCKNGHSFRNSPRQRLKGRGCPYCANQRVLEGFNDLKTRYPETAEWWDYSENAGVKPSEIMPGSNKKYAWICPDGHCFLDSVYSRVDSKGCPICQNKRLLTGFNDLQTRAYELSLDWDYEKNALHPSQVVFSTKKRYWWRCESGHSWRVDPQSRLFGTGCPNCSTTGFRPDSPAIFYFLKNEKLFARKIGITNTDSKVSRIMQFQARGWKVEFVIEDSNGQVVFEAEQMVKNWLRQQLQLGLGVSKLQMDGMSGFTETFAIDSPRDSEVTQAMIEGVRKAISKLTIDGS